MSLVSVYLFDSLPIAEKVKAEYSARNKSVGFALKQLNLDLLSQKDALTILSIGPGRAVELVILGEFLKVKLPNLKQVAGNIIEPFIDFEGEILTFTNSGFNYLLADLPRGSAAISL